MPIKVPNNSPEANNKPTDIPSKTGKPYSSASSTAIGIIGTEKRPNRPVSKANNLTFPVLSINIIDISTNIPPIEEHLKCNW